MNKTLLSIGFVACISLAISGCTAPLITLKVEEVVPAKRPFPYPTTRPLSCTVYTDGSEEPSIVDINTKDDQFPKLPPLDKTRSDDYEYITNHLLNYIEDLQEYIRENP